MTLRVVGAGLGRTGTASLKTALELLLGGPCHHMFEVIGNRKQITGWGDAAVGDMPDWHDLLDGYAAQVDWPGASFWPELMEAFPDALVLLSVRDHEQWYDSARATIFAPSESDDEPSEGSKAIYRMFEAIVRDRFTDRLLDREAAIAAAKAHNAAVIAGVPPERLLVWRASDGWGPICDRLGLAVPDTPFPHRNTAAEFLARRQGPN